MTKPDSKEEGIIAYWMESLTQNITFVSYTNVQKVIPYNCGIIILTLMGQS